MKISPEVFYRHEARKLLLLKYKKFFQSNFFSFFELAKYLLKFFYGASVSWNINSFPKYRKAFFLRNARNFCGLFVSWSMRNFLGVNFFCFSILDWKVQGSILGNITKAFFWENIISFLILERPSFISLGLKVAQVALKTITDKISIFHHL